MSLSDTERNLNTGTSYGSCSLDENDKCDDSMSSVSSDFSVCHEPSNSAFRDKSMQGRVGVLTVLGLFCAALIYMSQGSELVGYMSFQTPFRNSQSSGNLVSEFILNSTAFEEGGTLDEAYTCIGSNYSHGGHIGISPPLEWYNIPDGTEEFLLMMTTKYAKQDVSTNRYDWIVYSIPHIAEWIRAGQTDLGLPGGSYPEKPSYFYKAPCSTGAGSHNYTFTLYALSEVITDHINETFLDLSMHSWADGYEPDDAKMLDDDGDGVTAPILIDAMSSITLASASISVKVHFEDLVELDDRIEDKK